MKLISAFVFFSSVAFANKGYFISIDGLHPQLLKTMLEQKLLRSPRGFQYLQNNSLQSYEASPVEITLTAPSHVSTITCSDSSKHGIVANSMKVGKDVVSGFEYPFKSEAMWTSAIAQGKKVLTIGYVGSDGANEARTATYGISYPSNSLYGKSQTLEVSLAEVKKDYVVNLVINQKTNETKEIHVRLLKTKNPRLVLDLDSDTANGVLTTFNLAKNGSYNYFVTETNKDSKLFGYKRRILIQDVSPDQKAVKLYFSAATYNNAYPENYRKYLESINLIWAPESYSDPKKNDPTNVLKHKVEESNFLTKVARVSAMKFPYDIMLYYQPLIDSIEHAYFSLMKWPFDPKSTDVYTKVTVQAYQIIDRNLNYILSLSRPNDVIALMGDHGMARSLSTLNIGKAVKDLNLESRVDVVTSGALALLYSKDGSSIQVEGYKIKKYLEDVKWNNASSITHSYNKANDNKFDWQYGEAEFAYFTHEDLYFSNKPKDDNIFLEASAKGMHGQQKSLQAMNTAFFLKLADSKVKLLGPVSLIDAVPSFSKAFGIQPPKTCQGKSVF